MNPILVKTPDERSHARAGAWKTSLLILSIALLRHSAPGQGVLFDFENAPVHTSLPISVTVGGVTAQLSASGQGFSTQPANTMGFTPAGFSGYCIYPNSIYAADLQVTFSQTLNSFSILYAPQELACDSSATMRVTAYLNGAIVGTATTNAQAGTWPSETLAITNAQGFDRVVVHYDKPPVTGGDWGPIFMADNLLISLAPPPIFLTGAMTLPNGDFQFSFTNTPGMAGSVWATTNLWAPYSQWTSLGNPTETAPGQFQFTDTPAIGMAQRFYCVRVP
jgi:hypothetical protein